MKIKEKNLQFPECEGTLFIIWIHRATQILCSFFKLRTILSLTTKAKIDPVIATKATNQSIPTW